MIETTVFMGISMLIILNIILVLAIGWLMCDHLYGNKKCERTIKYKGTLNKYIINIVAWGLYIILCSEFIFEVVMFILER